MSKFIPGGPKRYAHQKKALNRIIETRGKTALLMDPGTGKSAVAIDYASLLAIKSLTGEARVLVLCPLVAVDSWVIQTKQFASPQVNYWVEALGGSTLDKAQSLAARNSNAFSSTRFHQKLKRGQVKRAMLAHKSIALETSGTDPLAGPGAVPGPRMVIEVVNIDTFAQRGAVGSKTMADVMLEAVRRFNPDLVIVDECHPAGTMVATPNGPRPIEELREGDQVLSFNESGIIVTTVTHTFSRETEEPIWTLGKTKATPEHPVWTTRGFIPISEVQSGDQIMRTVPLGVHYKEEHSEVLLGVVLEEVYVDPRDAGSTSRQTDPGEIPAGGSREITGAPEQSGQPVQRPRGQGSGGGGEPGGGLPRSTGTRGEWDGTDSPSETTRRTVGVGYGTGGGNRFTGAVRRLTQALQDRRGSRRSEGSRRGGRGVTQGRETAGAGHQKGQVPSQAGLGRVPLHEPAGDDGPGISRRVYNIETEAGTYFAEGLLVHNSHKIKSASGNASRLLARIQPFAPRRVILTGTVMPHSPLDVFGQWRFLQPTALGTRLSRGKRVPASFGEFKDRYAVLGGWMGKEVMGFKNLDELQESMALNSIVVRKEDALDLPPTTEVTLPVTLSAREATAYKDMKKDFQAQLAKGLLASTDNTLTQIMRMRQITSGHLPDDSGAVHEIGRSKAATIASLVHDTLVGEKRVVVFALFRKEIESLSKMLAKQGTEVMVITGDTKYAERIAMRKRFGGDDPQRIVMVAQIKTMSLAVNELVTASHAVFASLSQQRDDYVQARDRLDRIGQTRPVTFWHAVAPGTLDATVLQSHRDRTNLEDAVLRHVQSDE